MDALPRHIADLIRQGRKLEAIELLRAETGVDVARAEEAVERIGAGLDPLAEAPLDEAPEAPAVYLNLEELTLAGSGRKTEAIQRIRERTGLGLKEAKDLVDTVPGAAAATARVAVVAAVAILLLVAGVVAAVFLSAPG